MAAALIGAQLPNHEHPQPPEDSELVKALVNFSHARAVAARLDLAAPSLERSFDYLHHDELRMIVEGEEDDVLLFLSSCREEGVLVKAVREDDESEFRLVTNPDAARPDDDAGRTTTRTS